MLSTLLKPSSAYRAPNSLGLPHIIQKANMDTLEIGRLELIRYTIADENFN